MTYESFSGPFDDDLLPNPDACPECGSQDPGWLTVEYSGPSGVSHPDGGQEIIHQSGRKCRRCLAIQEDE
jgi:hypothetical protein